LESNQRGGSDATVLAMLLVAGAIWYYYAHCELGSTRDSSFLVAYRPVGAESLWIHHERVQAAQEYRIWINNPRYLQTRVVNSINYPQADHVSGRDSGRKNQVTAQIRTNGASVAIGVFRVSFRDRNFLKIPRVPSV
jgi:hypothetical protein